MTRTIEPWTAFVIVAGIAGVIAMAYLKVDLATFATCSSALIALAGSLRQLSYVKPVDVPASLTIAPDGSVKVSKGGAK